MDEASDDLDATTAVVFAMIRDCRDLLRIFVHDQNPYHDEHLSVAVGSKNNILMLSDRPQLGI